MSPPATKPLRVVIADDHPMYRIGLARSLRASGIDVVAEAPNGEAAIRAVQATAPDVVMMDLNMPGVSGLEATRVLTARDSARPVLMLSVSADEADVVDALLAGASGYVLKDQPVEEVIAGIRAAAIGESHISPEIALLLLRRLCESGGARLDVTGVRLSSEEQGVLDGLTHSRADHEVAETLAITQRELRARAASILMKLQADDRVLSALQAYRRR